MCENIKFWSKGGGDAGYMGDDYQAREELVRTAGH